MVRRQFRRYSRFHWRRQPVFWGERKEMNQRDSRRTPGYIKMLTSWKFLNPGFVSSGEYAQVRVDRVRGELGQNSASVSLPSLCMKVSERGKRYSIRDQTGPITSFRVTKELRAAPG
jgi:hypothetical protein